MSKYNVVDNTELVELIEQGLRKGYWDKALIPELKKRFKELEKKEKLLELYEALVIVKDDMLSYCEVVDDDYYDSKELATSFEKQIKEIENEIQRNSI